jgi:hypothetical protein
LILDKVNKTVADATITREPSIELPNGGKLKSDMVNVTVRTRMGITWLRAG